MYSEMVVFMFALHLIYLAIGCKKKKNEAAKLKPRNMSLEKAKAVANSPGPEKIEKGETPPKERSIVMRPADDNETINDAKSDWGVVP